MTPAAAAALIPGRGHHSIGGSEVLEEERPPGLTVALALVHPVDSGAPWFPVLSIPHA